MSFNHRKTLEWNSSNPGMNFSPNHGVKFSSHSLMLFWYHFCLLLGSVGWRLLLVGWNWSRDSRACWGIDIWALDYCPISLLRLNNHIRHSHSLTASTADPDAATHDQQYHPKPDKPKPPKRVDITVEAAKVRVDAATIGLITWKCTFDFKNTWILLETTLPSIIQKTTQW